MSGINLGPYSKAVNGTALALLGALVVALTDNRVEPWEWVSIAATTLTASGAIWVVRNGGALGDYGKAITAVVVTALGVLGTAVSDGSGVTLVEGLAVLIAFLNGFVVSNSPNAEESDSPAPEFDDFDTDEDETSEPYDPDLLPDDTVPINDAART